MIKGGKIIKNFNNARYIISINNNKNTIKL